MYSYASSVLAPLRDAARASQVSPRVSTASLSAYHTSSFRLSSLSPSAGRVKKNFLERPAEVRPGRVPANRFPEHPTAETKLRMVFDELDVNNERCIKIEGFRRLMQAVDVKFTDHTIAELFQRADLRQSGMVNFSEFLNWATHYPALIDALYHRSRELIDRARQEVLVKNFSGELERVQREEREMHKQCEEAELAVRERQTGLDNAAASVEAAIIDEKAKQKIVHVARGSAEETKNGRDATERDLMAVRAEEKRASCELVEVRHDVERQQHGIEDLEQRKAQAREVEKKLQLALKEVQAEISGIDANLEEAETAFQEAKRVESEKLMQLTDATSEVQRMQVLLREAETELSIRMEDLRQSVNSEKEAHRAFQAASEEQKVAEEALAGAREVESQARHVHTAASKAVESVNDQLREVQETLQKYLADNQKSYQELQPVLDDEVRLREQRFNLNTRDSVHSSATAAYFHESRFTPF